MWWLLMAFSFFAALVATLSVSLACRLKPLERKREIVRSRPLTAVGRKLLNGGGPGTFGDPNASTRPLVRVAGPADLREVSELLVECFESDLGFFEIVERARRRGRFERGLVARCGKSLKQHVMIVAEDSSQEQGTILGFVEAGYLPRPGRRGSGDGVTREPGVAQAAAAGDGPTPSKGGDEANGKAIFLANVCVAQRGRRKGLGRRLVSAGLRWARGREAEEVFVAVDQSNADAIALYESCDFVAWDVDIEEQGDNMFMRRALTCHEGESSTVPSNVQQGRERL